MTNPRSRSKHSPTPWKVSCDMIRKMDDSNIATIWSCPEDAAFIVKACNMHDELIEMLTFIRKFVGYEPNSEICKKMDSLLARAEE